jgi:hypothetical protein
VPRGCLRVTGLLVSSGLGVPNKVMFRKTMAVWLSLLSFNSSGETPQLPITQEGAKLIALSVAGCRVSDRCAVNGKFSKGAWFLAVLRYPVRDAEGTAKGQLIKRMPQR